jgi:hypothetical protein
MIHSRYSSTELVSKCQIISIIDGSLIDLTCRDHLPKKIQITQSQQGGSSCSLGKRSFQVFDYIKQKYLNQYRNKTPIEDQKYSNASLKMKNIQILNQGHWKLLNNENLFLRQNKTKFNLNSKQKQMKYKLKNAQKNPFYWTKKCAFSPRAMISTMSFGSNKKKKKSFFSEFIHPETIKEEDKLKLQKNDLNQFEQKSFGFNSSKEENLFSFETRPDKTKCYSEILEILISMYQVRSRSSEFSNKKRQFECILKTMDLDHNNLEGFQNLLIKFLKGEPIEREDMNLSDLEIILFLLFLVKKKFKKLSNLKWNQDSLNEVRSYGVNKRSEQNYKIILKRFFKKVIQNFNEERNLDLKNDFEFYKFYFQEIADSFNHDWEKLRFETVFNETKVCLSQEYRRQSKKFFARILKRSKPFMASLNNYLMNKLELKGKTHGIILDYLPILKKKSYLLTTKWRKNLYEETTVDKIAVFVSNQLKNNKVKLPWSLVEINQGIVNVRRLFERVE